LPLNANWQALAAGKVNKSSRQWRGILEGLPDRARDRVTAKYSALPIRGEDWVILLFLMNRKGFLTAGRQFKLLKGEI